jgi:hypothetical protein
MEQGDKMALLAPRSSLIRLARHRYGDLAWHRLIAATPVERCGSGATGFAIAHRMT